METLAESPWPSILEKRLLSFVVKAHSVFNESRGKSSSSLIGAFASQLPFLAGLWAAAMMGVTSAEKDKTGVGFAASAC
jgi:hypothetical protein